MDAVFFLATREGATRVRSVEDLEDDPAAEPLRVDSPGAVVALAVVLCGKGRGSIEQLRDATCQSFPVWSLSDGFENALSSVADEDFDSVAEAWLEKAGTAEIEADLFELTVCVTDLRRALARGRDRGERLFVLFEERALH